MAIDLINWTKQAGDPLRHNEVNEQNNKINELIEWVNNYEQRHHGAGGSIANAVVVGVSQTYTFTGEPIIPEFRVYVGGTLLVKGEDYDSQIDNNTEMGTATITIYGIGDYTESKVVTFGIEGAKYNLSYQSEHATTPSARRVSRLSADDVPTLTDADYNFLGWYDENNRQYNVGTILTHDVVLIARWEAKIFTLTYDTNGHGEVTQPTGKLSNLPNPLPTPTADGYYFAGWFNNGTKANDGDALTADTTLTAKWVANEVNIDVLVNDTDPNNIHAESVTLTAAEEDESVVVEYSTDNGSNWEVYTAPISLAGTIDILTRVKYEDEVISNSQTITTTLDDDAKEITFASSHDVVVDATTSEAVGAIDITSFEGTIIVTDGLQTAHLSITNTNS